MVSDHSGFRGAFDMYAPFLNRMGDNRGFEIIGVVISFRRLHEWSDQTISAFKVLVCRLTSAPVLALPDTRIAAMFTIGTNASNEGTAGVLLQD